MAIEAQDNIKNVQKPEIEQILNDYGTAHFNSGTFFRSLCLAEQKQTNYDAPENLINVLKKKQGLNLNQCHAITSLTSYLKQLKNVQLMRGEIHYPVRSNARKHEKQMFDIYAGNYAFIKEYINIQLFVLEYGMQNMQGL